MSPILPHAEMLPPPYEPPAPVDTTRLVSGLAAALTAHADATEATSAHALFIAHSLGTSLLASLVKTQPAVGDGRPNTRPCQKNNHTPPRLTSPSVAVRSVARRAARWCRYAD